MAEDDENKTLMQEIYDFIKELYLEEEDKKIELREKYIKNTFSINRFHREKMQYEKVNDTNIGFFNPNTSMLNEKIESIKHEIEKLSMEQAEEEQKLQMVEKRMEKISILRRLLAEKEEQERKEKERFEKEKKKRKEQKRLEKEEQERKEKERLEKEEQEQKEKEGLEKEEREHYGKERMEIEPEGFEKNGEEQKNGRAQSILETYETERQRIARDLHDTTIQNLIGLVHKTEYCLLLAEQEPVKLRNELVVMQETLKNTIDGMRNIIYDLRLVSIQDLKLAETVNKYIEQLESEYKEITFDVSIKNEERKMDSMVRLAIFRIIQEACNNTIKHGNASLIFISIEYKENTVIISVEDDGVGFNLKKVLEEEEKNKGFGLSIMKERAELISGILDIQSEEENGTSIKLIVPIV